MRDVIQQKADDSTPTLSVLFTKRRTQSPPPRIPFPVTRSRRSPHASLSSLSVPDSAVTGPEPPDNELTISLGQLSINEHEQFRYHGELSGLHILGSHERLDRRNEGGVWRFPAVKVFHGPGGSESKSHEHADEDGIFGVASHPTKLRSDRMKTDMENEIRSRLPDKETQRRLLSLFWTYVHPLLPVLDKVCSKSIAEEVMSDLQ